MTTFGFSAFVKILCSNVRPRRRIVGQRLLPADEGGYDFHKGTRRLVHRYLSLGESIEAVMASAELISNPAERRSAISALDQILTWRSENVGPISAVPPAIYESPNAIFKVRFDADFGIELEGVRTGIHVWNTITPQLDPRVVYAALSLFPNVYEGVADAPSDIGLLSLRALQLYRLSDVGSHAGLAALLVQDLERVFAEVAAELGIASDDEFPDSPMP